jgi:protein O-GlcNAc transferase
VDPNFAEGYSNLGNALKELGDLKAAVQFYLKATKLKPRFVMATFTFFRKFLSSHCDRYSDAYNNLASAYMQLGQTQVPWLPIFLSMSCLS